MALISIAVWDTDENKRTEYTHRTIESLKETVDFSKHRLIISDNGSCTSTMELYWRLGLMEPPGINNKSNFLKNTKLTLNGSNLGTAEAINKAWIERLPGENAVKMDNDVIIHSADWVDEMENAIHHMPSIGIIGLKRKDCWENPNHPDPFYKSKLQFIPHQPGEKWVVVEEVNHVMGTCQMYNSKLLDKIGYLYQPRLYGFDDAFAAFRCKKAGFKNVFLPHIHIDHIDRGDTPYQKWKEQHSGEDLLKAYPETVRGYLDGTKSIYYNPFNKDNEQ